MLAVHHLNNSRSQRVLWLLEELNLPYEIRHYQRDAETMLAPPELKSIHPLGKSPVITDDLVTVAETGTIIEYIVEKTGGRLRPARGTPEQLRWTYWMHFAEGSVQPALVMKLIFGFIPERAPFYLKPLLQLVLSRAQDSLVTPRLKLYFDLMESELAKSEWFAGSEFSAADVMMSFPIETGVSRANALEGRPHLKSFLQRIHARPAYRAALQKGGPYAFAQ